MLGEDSSVREDKRLLVSTSTEEKRPFRHPYLIEPALVLYMLTRWCLPTGTSEYLKSRLEEEYLMEFYSSEQVDLEEIRFFVNYTADMENEIQSDAAQWLLYINLATDIPAIVATLFLVPYTDKIGRKPGIFLPCCGAAIYSLVLVLVVYLDWPLEVLFAGCIIQGLSGSLIALQGVCFAYTCDVVPFESRTFRFAVLNALIVGSASVSNLGLGFFIDAVGFGIPFVVMTFLFAADAVYVLLFVPESRPEKQRANSTVNVVDILNTTVKSFGVYRRPREDPTARTQLCLLICSISLYAMAFLGRMEVDTLFVIGPPFDFTATMVGVFLGVRAAVWLIGELTITRLTQPCIGDAARGVISIISAIGGNMCMALAGGEIAIWLSIVVGLDMCGAVSMSYVLMSKQVTSDEQGALMGTISTVETVFDVLSDLTLDGIYSATVTFYPGLVYWIIVGLYSLAGCCIVLVWFLKWRGKQVCSFSDGIAGDVDSEKTWTLSSDTTISSGQA